MNGEASFRGRPFENVPEAFFLAWPGEASRVVAALGTGCLVKTLFFAMLCFLLSFSPQVSGEEVSPEDVKIAIEKGTAAVRRNLQSYRGRSDPGYSVLGVMALLNCGVSADDPSVSRALVEALRTADQDTKSVYTGTYRAGLLLMVLGMVKDPRYKDFASAMCRTLLRFQAPNGGWGDNSRTQFALLGLKAAEEVGIKVDSDVFMRAKRYVLSGQHEDGGWGYVPVPSASYGSMTVAGISSLSICGARLYRGTNVCGVGASDRTIAHALEWMTRNFTVRTNPQKGSHHFYYLYGLERIGVLLAQRTIGRHDWYREGAAFLVGAQQADGSWRNEALASEFALLFLGKGSQPVAMQKLRYGEDWNSDPYDIKHLVERAAKDLHLPMTFQVVDTGAKAEELAVAPILYLQGHKDFHFDLSFRRALQAFVDQGGFIFASACCGASAFDQAFRREMRLLFPDSELEKLAPDHSVYRVPQRLTQPEAFMIEGLNTGCRTSVLYAPHDVCCAWGQCMGCRDAQRVKDDFSMELGVNMIAFALDFQRLRDKLEKVEMLPRLHDHEAPRGALLLGQLYHGGDWNPDPSSLPNLTKTLRVQAGVKSQVYKRRVVLGEDDPGDFPLLYLTGHRSFTYSAEQIKQLRAYLDNGGFLLSDPCCGKAEFDAAFRTLCKALYPERELQRLDAEHVVFQSPFKIDRVTYKPWAERLFPDLDGKPFLEGISQQGRLAILYSRFNFGCELQGHTCNMCVGLAGQDAYRIAVNALLYALSH